MGSVENETVRAEILRPTEEATVRTIPAYVQEMMPLSDQQINFVASFQARVGEYQWPSHFALARVGRTALGAKRVKSIIEDCRNRPL